MLLFKHISPVSGCPCRACDVARGGRRAVRADFAVRVLCALIVVMALLIAYFAGRTSALAELGCTAESPCLVFGDV